MNAPELMEPFDDDCKNRNYTILINTISFLENAEHVTEDWMEENKDRITLYREYFEDFTRVNPEIEDRAFRKLAEETEVLMSYLYVEVIRTYTFNIRLFLQLNKHILALATGVFKENDLPNMFKNMGI